jgi:hypothetical protein
VRVEQKGVKPAVLRRKQRERRNGSPNRLVASLSARDGQLLWPHLKTVDLTRGEVLAQPQQNMRRVYFPHSGIVSFMVELRDGHVVQTGMVGRDGAVGAIQALDDRVSLN